MKKIIKIIEENAILQVFCFIVMYLIALILLVGFSMAPIIILELVFGFDLSHNSSAKHSIKFLWFIGSLLIYFKYVDNDRITNKIITAYCLIGLFFFSVSIFNEQHDLETPSVSYHVRREYSPNYSYHDTHSSSSYRHSEPSYTSPTKIPDDDVIPYSPQIKTEEIVENEPLITPKDDEEHNNQSFSEPSDINPEEISPPPSGIGLFDIWEYVTSDEQGNKYYINKNFGVHSIATSIEGNVFSASFKKVLNNGGREVEVPAYDINRGMITEKKIVAYEESIIRFRNENGIKEFSFSTISGYTSKNSIIVGYGIANVDNIFEWKPINDEVYNSLYDSAYKKL